MRADRKPKATSQVGFYVLAPEEQIRARTFNRLLDKQSIKDKVKRRIKPYDRELDDWYKDWFTPTLEIIDIRSISWESILDIVKEKDSKTSDSLQKYYLQCLTFNS